MLGVLIIENIQASYLSSVGKIHQGN